ncbi:MAG: MltA domain-containing protein [Rhodobacter sp.]|jgi:membrane-bound lytic murein transglycosylase A|nr:MltA domain-containing protein [Rhodobacter sp.]
MRSAFAAFALLCALAIAATAAHAQRMPRYKALRFDQLLGWGQDDHAAALRAFLISCPDISAPEWAPICAFGASQTNAKAFFETFFTPVVVRPGSQALFTGYFEPDLDGSRTQQGRYQYPIYRMPKAYLKTGAAMPTRQEIDNGTLKGMNLEIAWVDDPVEAYYLHIQGSGRINLTDGTTVRVGYAGENGHVYRSAAQEMVRQGLITYAQASIEGIRNWVSRNPQRGQLALQNNSSYVFFRELKNHDLSLGLMGALDRPITALRTIAVDPKYTQLGAPVWLEKGGQFAMRRLVIAQDVGSAIKGPQRADIFFGTGDIAGKLAGQTKNGGGMVVLLPIAIANRLAPEG